MIDFIFSFKTWRNSRSYGFHLYIKYIKTMFSVTKYMNFIDPSETSIIDDIEDICIVCFFIFAKQIIQQVEMMYIKPKHL